MTSPAMVLWWLMKPDSTAELKPISVLKMLPTPVANDAKPSEPLATDGIDEAADLAAAGQRVADLLR